MKRILLTVLLMGFFACAQNVTAQWTSFPFTLEDDNGDPMTGQSSNLKFTKYPHTYPDDIISGITVTEIGTQGTYNASGFTTLQFAKLWLSGVVRTEFDSVLTGNLFTFLQSNYWRTNASQTGLTGAKTISSGNWTISTGDWLKLAGTETWSKPYIYSGSTWVSNYSEGSGNSLVWRDYADSVYGIKPYFLNGSEIRLNTGYKIYGRTNSVSPIPINTSHFTYGSDQLSLNSAVLNADSIKHKNLTVGKDTTWVVLGENVTKWRFISLKKGFWANAYTIPEWKWVYTSFDESGVLQAMDSMMVINEVLEVDNETSVSVGYTGSYALIDSLTLPPGKYHIDFGVLFERPDHNNAAQVGISDTLEIALKEESSAPNVYIKRYIRDIHTYTGTKNFDGSALNWSAVLTVYSTSKKVYLYGRYLGTDLADALGLGPTVSFKRGRIVATLIR